MSKSSDDAPDILVANRVLPDAAGVFYSGYKPLEAIVGDCVVVVDTNALLVPYSVGNRGLKEVASTYRRLAADDRLVIPGQVAREFGRNRPLKVAELVQAIGRKRDMKELQRGRYPLLEGVPTYERLVELERQVDTLLREYRRTVEQVLDDVAGWSLNDPVSAIYGEILPKCVEDPALTPESIHERLRYSALNKIPPGYKDAAKDDGGVGDLLIWNTILAVAAARKTSVIFVSGDVKADWVHRSENLPLFPRFELVDEFRRASGGETLHIVTFSRLLELFGATPETVQEVRREEGQIQASPGRSGRAALALAAEDRVLAWLYENYPDLTVDQDSGADFAISDRGAVVGVEVKFFPDFSAARLMDAATHAHDILKREANELDSVILFLIGSSALVTSEIRHKLRGIHHLLADGVTAVVGRVLETGDLVIHDPLDILPRTR